MSLDVDCIVIGAGVIGLAIARRMAISGLSVYVLEKETQFGTQISSRNSEVIHAGIYYPKNSLKADLCVKGRNQIYAYCQDRDIAHLKCGKLIVATDEVEAGKLHTIKEAALANGVDDIIEISAAKIKELEPQVNACAALLSPSTGILDSHAFMLSLQGDIENAGGQVVFQCPVQAIIVKPNHLQAQIDDSEQTKISAKYVFNCTGLAAQKLAQNTKGYDPSLIPPLYYVPGRYYILSGRPVFNRLIYPVPTDGGLGVHATLDMQGQIKFGPDARWTDRIDYSVPERCPKNYIAAIRKYYPNIDPSRLHAGYVGVRPKLAAQGEGFKDFIIQTEQTHNCAGLVHLFGIESPGLTASLAIAKHVDDYIAGQD
ncbi:MAG: NAD(P)/FAD-dependent oxidoreductase [Robiginitomaculum sp.]|nr:NAD(P)/FAD-dependent oxidoreductase [Robiginitomaculum sp.]